MYFLQIQQSKKNRIFVCRRLCLSPEKTNCTVAASVALVHLGQTFSFVVTNEVNTPFVTSSQRRGRTGPRAESWHSCSPEIWRNYLTGGSEWVTLLLLSADAVVMPGSREPLTPNCSASLSLTVFGCAVQQLAVSVSVCKAGCYWLNVSVFSQFRQITGSFWTSQQKNLTSAQLLFSMGMELIYFNALLQIQQTEYQRPLIYNHLRHCINHGSSYVTCPSCPQWVTAPFVNICKSLYVGNRFKTWNSLASQYLK